jgi:hypothetical protein
VIGRLHRAAAALAGRGMAVFPCIPQGKTPACSHGALDATTDIGAIDQWWIADPERNIGVATGAASGIFVVDVDDAEAALGKLEAEHGALPPTVEVITGRGRHLWFRLPADQEIRNSAGRVARGIDIRGEGGYVLTPPSVHPSGRRYTWSVDSANAIAQAPAWLLAKVAETAGSCTATPPSEWIKLAAEGAAEGARNDSIARLTGHLLRRYVDPRLTLELVRAWNAARCHPPLSDRELEQIINSIAGKELRRRQEAGHGR